MSSLNGLITVTCPACGREIALRLRFVEPPRLRSVDAAPGTLVGRVELDFDSVNEHLAECDGGPDGGPDGDGGEPLPVEGAA